MTDEPDLSDRVDKLERDLAAVTVLLADLSIRVCTEEIVNERDSNV